MMFFCQLKEAARTSILSHRWKHLWKYHRILNFEDPLALKRMYKSRTMKVRDEERTNFISWANDIMNNHIGLVVDEFRIVFDLDTCCQSHINKWLTFAFEKHVKSLDLNFLMFFATFGRCTLPLECLPHNLASNNSSLTSLRLHEIDITTEALEHILNSLPLLEHLCISASDALTSLRISGMSSKLTYLKLNVGVKQVPVLPNLKHLKLEVVAKCNQSIFECISLIEASPMLQKLTVKFKVSDFITPRPIPKRYGKPLMCLKTFELLGFVGSMIDLEFATYVLEKARVLEEAIVSCDTSSNGAERRVRKLRRKLPHGARLILMESSSRVNYL